MKNSSPYRKAPIKRTRDSFIDDTNSSENPRIDFGQSRHTQVRRDTDKKRSLGITLYDIDFAVKSFIDQTMQLRIEDNGQLIEVPTLYANSEKWTSIQRNGYLKDKKGKTLVPLITFRRSGVNMKQQLRRNKVASSGQLAYVMKQKYNQLSPYDRFSSLYGTRAPQEYFVTPIPDYVDITYDFILWCEYQSQLNELVEQFVYYGGKSFGEKNFFKFASSLESLNMEDSNSTGQDRLVRANFQLMIHAYLLPKSVAGEVTTKRVVAPNKIVFESETSRDINGAIRQNQEIYGGDPFKSLNQDKEEIADDLQRRLRDNP